MKIRRKRSTLAIDVAINIHDIPLNSGDESFSIHYNTILKYQAIFCKILSFIEYCIG